MFNLFLLYEQYYFLEKTQEKTLDIKKKLRSKNKLKKLPFLKFKMKPKLD